MLKNITLAAVVASSLFAIVPAQAASTDRSGMTAIPLDQSRSITGFVPARSKSFVARSSNCQALKEMADRMSSGSDRDAVRQYIACISR